jgi:chemotaxis family two-component system response regulator PixG
VLTVALQLWQDWQESGLTAYSPNHAPVLRQPDILKQQISSKAFATLSKVVNGQRTLRDVAVLMRQDILRLGRSLLPLIEQQLVQLIEVGDREGTTPTIQAQPEAPKPLIACIDDSPQVCQTMQTIVESAGYRFIGIQDSIRAVPVLLQNKPDLIFLDLVMPVAYGYEICTQIRRVATFRTIPVIILTGNDGVVDRLRAKMVGATDFLTKPVEKDKVISTIHQFCTAPQPNSR